MKLLLPIKRLLSKDKKLTEFFRNVFGYYPKNILLYKLALCHRSSSTEQINGIRINNERLEFLGDAILSAVIADYLFKKFPHKDEGFLTEMRSRIVSRENLNKLSLKLGINKHIQSDHNNICRSMNGDALEAIIGAMFLDKGFLLTKKILVNRIIKFHLDIDELENKDLNFKSRLIEWAQKEKKQVEFCVVKEEGSGYNKHYIVNVLINKEIFGTGRDHTIKKAEQNAAKKSISMLFGENTHSIV